MKGNFFSRGSLATFILVLSLFHSRAQEIPIAAHTEFANTTSDQLSNIYDPFMGNYKSVIGQTFTALHTAPLKKIMFYVEMVFADTAHFDLEVYSCNSTSQFTTLLGTISELTMNAGWDSVDVSSLNIQILSGGIYGFKLNPRAGFNAYIQSDYSKSYTGGTQYITSIYDFDTFEDEGTDLLFQITGENCGTAPTVQSNQVICSYGLAQLTASVPGGTHVEWYLDSIGGVAFTTGTSVYSDDTVYESNIYYAIAVNDITGCTSYPRTSITVTASPTPTVNTLNADLLVVSGGGSGGSTFGGGGGGGSVKYFSNISIPIGSTTVTVGSGGTAVTGGLGNPGNPSAFGAYFADTSANAKGMKNGGGQGGSGGGSGGWFFNETMLGGVATPGLGYNGGNGSSYAQYYRGAAGGGGGGAGGVGKNAYLVNYEFGQAGAGGEGKASSISGTLTYYGGGGGGGCSGNGNGAGAGGIGGGGAGSKSDLTATSGTPNTGGGGGGAGNNGNTPGTSGAGGSGIVIIRYIGTPKASGGTITQSGGYTIHTFTSSGTFTLSGDSLPPIIVNDQSRSGNGAVTFSGIAPSGYTFDWYTASTGGTATDSGSVSFTTASLSDTTVYYVAARNTITGCQSEQRIPITALVQDLSSALTVSDSLNRFSYCPNSASSAQSFTVSGTNLTDPIGIKAPTGFEVSETSGSGYADSITLTPSSGSVATTIIYIRVKDNASGALSGSVTVSTSGASSQTVAVYAATDNALNFDGTNDYVDCGKPTATRLTNNFTIGAWIKTSLAAQRTYLTNQWVYHSSGMLLGLTAAGKLHIAYTANSSGSWTYRDPDTVLSDGKWHYVVVSFESGRLRTYIDSVLVDNYQTAYTTVYYSGGPSLVIGKDGGSGVEHWDGSIDDVSIWSKVLSQSDVTNTMVNGITGSESNLVLYYDFNQGIAEGTNTGLDSLTDRSSNNIKGTLTNMTLTGSTSNWVQGRISEISGSSSVYVGQVVQLSNPLTGGAWSSSNTGVATVNSSTGLVTGIGQGSATITYDLCGRQVTTNMTVSCESIEMNVVAFTDSTICDGAPAKLVAATGNGMNFNSNNSLSVSSDSRFNFTNSMTFEAWIKTTTTSSAYLTSRESGFWVYLLEGAGNTGKVGFWLEGISSNWMISNKTVNDGKWHHVAATYDRQYMKIYIDGKLAAFEAKTNAMVSQNNAVYLGSRGGSFKFNGSMDEVRYWNTARTASEIVANMHNVLSSGTSGLVAYYRMDESSGTSVVDSSGNGLNGTVVGIPSWLSPSKAPVAGNKFVNYNWSNGETTSSITFFTSAQSTYSVTATSASGCTYADDQTIYISGSTAVVPSVKITSSDSDNIIASGTSVTFTATPTNGGNDPLYVWKKNDVQVGANSVTYTASDLADGDVVKVVMFSTASCLAPTDTAVSNASTITIGTKVAASSNESNLAYPELGQYAAFSMAMVNGFPTFVSCNRFHTLAQTFTAQETAQLSRILFNVYISNSTSSNPIGSFDLKIYACSDDTTFTTLLGEVNDVTILSTGWKSVDVSSLHIPVTSGSKYGFLLSTKLGLNMLVYQDMTGSYTEGKIYVKRTTSCPAGSPYPNDSTWSGSSDLLFRITGTPLVTPSVTITSSDSDNLICSGSSVTFTATPVNGGSSPFYQWKLNGSNVGTNSNTYTTSALSNSDSVRVVMTSNASDLTVDTAVSNTIKTTIIAVGSNDLWLGNTSTSWLEGSNWCDGSVPANGSSIVIPAGLTNYPVLSGNVSVADLELATGATLSLNGNELTVTGNLSGTGRFIGSSTSSLIYGGSGSSDTVYFSTTAPGTTDALANLTYDRSGQTLTVGDTLNIYGVITPTAGTLNANGKLVLKSNASGTARIAAGSGNYITGEVTVERYLPNRNRTYRLLTPTVNTSGSIRTNWMENGLNTSIGVNNDPNPGYGTQITGISGNVNGFDVSGSNQPSLYLTSNGVAPTYTAVTSTGGTLDAKTGYFLFVRGDRTMDMTLGNTNLPPNPIPLNGSSTTLRAKGSLVTGTVNSFSNSLSSAEDALNLVTNPYASPISWASVYGASSNITQYYTLWDPSVGYRGGFVTVSTTGVVNVSIADTSAATNIIQPGQAFFVQSTGPNAPTVVIEEAHKTSGNNNAVFAPATLPKASLQASIYYKEASGYRRLSDGVLSQMDAAYSNAVNSGDAVEITNWDENLAILQGGKRLAIEQRSIPTASDTLNLYISNMKRMTYEMEVKAQGMADASLQPYLIDRFTGTQTLLKNNESTIVLFTVNSNAASSASNRFYVIFKNTGTLPVRIVQFRASAKDKAVLVSWQVEEDESVDHYEVERSKDQSIFNKIGVQMASGKNLASAQYSLLDNDPFTGNNFYRLKLVEKSGEVKYSKVERVTFSGRPWSVSVFPNPFSGTELQLKLDQWPAGNYRISITDVLGRVLFNRIIETPGGNLTIPIGINGAKASFKQSSGVYWMKIEGEGIEEVRKVMRE